MTTVNRAVRDHQTETKIDWKHQEVARLCWEYYDRFRQAFFPGLPDCYLRCGPMNRRQKFAYRRGDNDVGAQFEFVLNSEWLGLPRYQVAALILHGQIHIWQESVGRPSSDAYHNREFQERSTALGIPCKPGRSCDVVAWKTPFEPLVMRDPDALLPVVTGVEIPTFGKSRLKKWSCGCTNMWSMVDEIDALCRKCDQPFVRER